MEGVAWFTHRYVMHGFLWFLHRDHHKKDHSNALERNDLFFLLFALPGIALLMTGFQEGYDWKFWAGVGITLYGLAYFLIHDLFIHQRLRVLRNTENVYLQGIRRGHKMHHRQTGKEHGECFGMLIVPFRYWKQAKAAKNR